MVNYYKQFESFKKQLKETKNIPLEKFKGDIMVFFGFGGRNKTLDRWIANFTNVKLITVKKNKENGDWFVDIIEKGR
jgi:hypothetical protein